MARARSSGRNEAWMMARLAGAMRAPPTPWTTRAATSTPLLGARPQAAEDNANQIAPMRKMRRRPKWSPSEPPSRRKAASVSRYPVTTHCSEPTPPWKLRFTDGSAIPTTVESSMAIPEPSTVAAMTQRPRALFRISGAAATGPADCSRSAVTRLRRVR